MSLSLMPMGFGQTSPPALERFPDALVSTGRVVAGPLMDLGDGGGGQSQGGDTGATAGPGRQVAGHGEGFRRQGPEGQLGAPVVKKPPLGPVDPAGVGGQDGLQGGGDGLVGSAQLRQGRRTAADY